MPMGIALAEEEPVAIGPSRGYLYLMGWQDSLTPVGSGGGASIEWLDSLLPEVTLDLGLAKSDLAGASVSYIKLGGYWKSGSGIAYHLETRVGSGSQNNTSFSYQIIKGGLSFSLAERLSLELEDEYLHVAQTEVNLVKPSLTYVPLSWLGMVVKYQRSMGGNISINFLSGELDFYIERLKIYGGYGSGSSVLDQNIITGGAFVTEERFYGISFPLGAYQVDLILDSISQPGIEKSSATLGWKIPI